jgi:hypothetical protein
MSDIKILKDMLQESLIASLNPHPYNENKNQVTLKETDANYVVIIDSVPTESEVIVIKTDAFAAPKAIFKSSKHECKRADFVIILNTDKHKKIIFIELKAKSTTSLEADIILQFKGAKCFIAYCQEIGKVFWNEPSFLDHYEYRYVSIRNIGIAKKTTREKKYPTHDQPEKMLKIGSPHHLQFKQLI